MLVFLDTEFTNLTAPDLISIGLIDEPGDRFFYAEVSDFNINKTSEFVKEVVLPQLGQAGVLRLPSLEIKNLLLSWLEPYSVEGVTIGCDYEGDWKLLSHLLGGDVPRWMTYQNIWNCLNQEVLETFWAESGLTQHHALYDAIANRFAFRRKPG